MNITKYGHSCLLIEEDDARILIDPGAWSEGHTTLTDIDAILITHEHLDHCDPESLQQILRLNKDAIIYTNDGVGKKLVEAGILFTRFVDGHSLRVKGVLVEGFGKDHAIIYPTFPHWDNTGFLIAERFFHPGDAVDIIPTKPVEILALPVVAPWMRMADALDWAKKIKPKFVFPIHDGMLKITGPFHNLPKQVLGAEGIVVEILEHGIPCAYTGIL